MLYLTINSPYKELESHEMQYFDHKFILPSMKKCHSFTRHSIYRELQNSSFPYMGQLNFS
jgi:hypothetical protein